MLFLRLFFGCYIQMFPFALLCFYPFTGQCRYPDSRIRRLLVKGIFVLSGLFAGVCVIIRDMQLVPLQYRYLTANLVFMILLIPCLFLYIYMTIGLPSKKLFVFLFSVTAAFVMTSLCNLAIARIPNPSLHPDGFPYAYVCTPILLASSFLILPPLCLLLNRKFIPASSALGSKEYRQLCFLSLILLLILVVGAFPLSNSSHYSLHMLCLYFALIVCTFMIYYIFFQIFTLQQKHFEADRMLEYSRQQIRAQNEYYENIIRKTEENRRLRHDFRQHLIVMQGFAIEKDYDKLSEYLSGHLKHLDNLGIPKYSSHIIINILLSHYQAICQEENISFQPSVSALPELSISDGDLSALLGNLLENALNGARHTLTDDKYILVHIGSQSNQFIITVDNSFDGIVNETINTSAQKIYLSTKKDHTGYGILSISQICKKYDGTSMFSHEGTVFHASAVIAIS